ncbi:MAG: helix-turn-helix domain-containing protein [Candidatus Liptonbacteria bacterium]|nr:helix-turn-helix domain-containing protein [Candidatus Liptonbacteria bacterium]
MSNNNPQSKIGKNLKKLRQEKGILQDRLSKLADLSFNTVVTVELGANPNPTIETLMKITKTLGVGLEEIYRK